MLLQLAVDDPDHIGLIPGILEYVDIVEVGTPLLKRFGLSAIATVRDRSGGKPILVDTKTVDGGAEEARMVFGEGAALMTVLSVASDATISIVDEIARRHGAYVVLDTIGGALPRQPSQYPGRFTHVGLHEPADRLPADAGTSEHVDAIASMHALGYQVSIAGGIGSENIASVVEHAPEIVVVGRAITEASNPRRAAEWLSSQLTERGLGWPPLPKSQS